VRILTEPGRLGTQPGKANRATALREITGDGKVFTNTPRFTELMAKERLMAKEPEKRTDANAQMLPETWVLLAEQLRQTALTTSDDQRGSGALKVFRISWLPLHRR
jgi:hypothetical protein